MDLLGNDALHSEEMMMKMWGDSMKAVNCTSRITYDDFLLLMKGQTREPQDVGAAEDGSGRPDIRSAQLASVPENIVSHSPIQDQSSIMRGSNGNLAASMPPSSFLSPFGAGADVPLVSDFEDGPLSMDDDDDLDSRPSPLSSHFTPPTTPNRGVSDYMSPLRDSDDRIKKFTSKEFNGIPALPPQSGPVIRKRSRSVGGSSDEEADDGQPPASPIRRSTAIILPENDKLFLAQGDMRLSVLQACKLFEEQQVKHARGVLMAQREDNEVARAGLVMRRVENRTIPSDDIKKLLDDYQRERQAAMAKATKRGGRGRHTRKKTISDMTAMMNATSPPDGSSGSPAAADDLAPPPTSLTSSTTSPSVIPSVISVEQPPEDLRKATVPGEFRRVNDPFGARGKYGSTAPAFDAIAGPQGRRVSQEKQRGDAVGIAK